MSVQSIADSATEILEKIVAVADEHNKTVDDFNAAIDRITHLETQALSLQASIDAKNITLNKQSDVIDKAIEHKGYDTSEIQKLRAELKLLQQLDPKRLEKVNKTQKAKIGELKTDIEAARKMKVDAMRNASELGRKMKAEGRAPFYQDPKSGNSVRVIPGLYIAKENDYGGIPDTPVFEFHHRGRGITRQGMLLKTGGVSWAMAQNSSPSDVETQIAKDHVIEYCKANKVSLKFIKEIKKAA